MYESLEVNIPLHPRLLLLNDDSQMEFTEKQRKVWLAGLTAGKKTYCMYCKKWLTYFQEVTVMKLEFMNLKQYRCGRVL